MSKWTPKEGAFPLLLQMGQDIVLMSLSPEPCSPLCRCGDLTQMLRSFLSVSFPFLQ